MQSILKIGKKPENLQLKSFPLNTSPFQKLCNFWFCIIHFCFDVLDSIKGKSGEIVSFIEHLKRTFNEHASVVNLLLMLSGLSYDDYVTAFTHLFYQLFFFKTSQRGCVREGDSESKGNCNYSNFVLLCSSTKSRIAV